MTQRTTKSIRLSDDAQRLLRILSAFENKTEGTLVEEALSVYVQTRSLGYTSVLPEARELAHTTPEDLGDTVERLLGAIEDALENGRHAPEPGSAKQRLRERAS